jgi:hypothetical protein
LAVLARPFTRALYVLFLGSTKYVWMICQANYV